MKQIIQQPITVPSNLANTVQELNNSLKSIAPANSETTKLITYNFGSYCGGRYLCLPLS